MRRVSTYEFTDEEAAALDHCRQWAEAEAEAQAGLYRAVIDAIELGLPTRIVGMYAHYSPAQVSRITTGKVSSATGTGA